MKIGKKAIIISLGLAALICAFAFFAYPIIKNRYFSPMESEKGNGLEQEKNSAFIGETRDGTTAEPSVDGSESEEEVAPEEQGDVGSMSVDVNIRNEDKNVFAGITNTHCNSDCKAFANNFEYLEYCEQVCGLLPIKDVSEADCEKKSGLQADYCYKDLAIGKKDMSLCNKIKDANILQTCKNRLIEEEIENR